MDWESRAITDECHDSHMNVEMSSTCLSSWVNYSEILGSWVDFSVVECKTVSRSREEWESSWWCVLEWGALGKRVIYWLKWVRLALWTILNVCMNWTVLDAELATRPFKKRDYKWNIFMRHKITLYTKYIDFKFDWGISSVLSKKDKLPLFQILRVLRNWELVEKINYNYKLFSNQNYVHT